MDRDWLAGKLSAGRSIESLARELGKPPSTVAYWVDKYGLASSHAGKHASKGGIPREVLEELLDRSLSGREIAAELGVSQASVRHWLARYGLQTARARIRHAPVDSAALPDVVQRRCATHGVIDFVREGERAHYRCRRCRQERVAARRRKIKEILVREAGGACALCGYGRFWGALQFHHVDPADKRFGIASKGVARSLQACRAEAQKCVLLCAN